MPKVVFDVEFGYAPQYRRPCYARVKLELPRDGDKYGIPWEVQAPTREVFGSCLGRLWGYTSSSGKYRYSVEKVTGTSWGEVSQRVKELIEDTLVTLRKVVEENRKVKDMQPVDYRKEVCL